MLHFHVIGYYYVKNPSSQCMIYIYEEKHE